MPLYRFEGVAPRIHPTAFVAANATIIGDVTIEEGASVWYGAVLRGDTAPIRICRGANVQDGAVLHGGPDGETYVGPHATIAHLAVVHGAHVGEGALVANGATVLDGARIGDWSLVAAHSFVSPGTAIPPGTLAAGSPATVKRELAGSPAEELVRLNGPAYAELAKRHAVGIEIVD